jgi:hypothetical protein
MFPYKAPALCARCGSHEVVTTWNVKKNTAKPSPWIIFTMWLGFYTIRNLKYSFEVPVCAECKDKLSGIQEWTNRLMLGLAILGAIVSLVYGFMKVAPGTPLDLALILSAALLALFAAIIGLGVGWIISFVIKDIFYYEFCKYDGKYFKFENKDFQREFAALNPNLVKMKKKLF